MMPSRMIIPRSIAAKHAMDMAETKAHVAITRLSNTLLLLLLSENGLQLGQSLGRRILREDLSQQLRLDVPAAHNRDRLLRCRQFVTMKHPGCVSDCSAGLRQDPGVTDNLSHGAADFILGHRNNVVHKLPDVLEVQRSYRLSAQPIGQCARDTFRGELNDLALAKTLLRVVGEFRFNADNFRGRSTEFERTGYSADEAASTYWHQDKLDVRTVLQNLQAGCSLASDDEFVVVRRHDGVTVLHREFFGLLHPLATRRTDDDDFRAQGGRAVPLDLRRVPGHDDHGLHTHRPRGICNALSVIAAGVRNNAALPLLL